jgi:periplasmic protein TonB
MMRIAITLFFFAAIFLTVSTKLVAQNTEAAADTTKTEIEQPAMFPGGMEKFYEYIKDNLKYPSKARKKGVEGTVFIAFVIGKDGKVGDVELVKGIDKHCDAAALKVIKNSPPWIPAFQRNKLVRYRLTVPIKFKMSKRR